jgi:hypothetical protein
MENTAMEKIITDVRQTPEYGEYIDRIGWETIKIQDSISNVQIFCRKLGPVGIAKIQRVKLPLPWDKIRPELKRRKTIMCKVEPLPGQPSEEIKKIGFCQDKWPLLSSKTIRLDINPPLEEIEKRFKKDARYCLNKAREAAIEIKQGDWGLFYEIWQKTAKNKGLWIIPKKDLFSLKESFGDKAICLTAGKIAGEIILVTEGVTYYYFSAALPPAKEYQLPYRMVWEGIKEGKKRGAKIWDFEGIYDERWPIKSWKGFTHFKKSFGGTEVEYPGSFVRWGLW